MTNQASEDDLRERLEERLRSFLDYAEWCGWKSVEVQGPISDIEALIRTEKLKLLADVKERVVGEDLPLPEEIMAQTGTRLYNKIKSEEREALDKLEAEL